MPCPERVGEPARTRARPGRRARVHGEASPPGAAQPRSGPRRLPAHVSAHPRGGCHLRLVRPVLLRAVPAPGIDAGVPRRARRGPGLRARARRVWPRGRGWSSPSRISATGTSPARGSRNRESLSPSSRSRSSRPSCSIGSCGRAARSACASSRCRRARAARCCRRSAPTRSCACCATATSPATAWRSTSSASARRFPVARR